MAKVPSLVSACNGKPETYMAPRQVSCCRCDLAIPKGAMAARIPTKKGAYRSKAIYCIGCLDAIIKQTRIDLCALEKLCGFGDEIV